MTQWWQFDGPDTQENEADALISAHEKAALAAIRAIGDLAAAHPDKALVIGGALRKIATVSQSSAQTLSLRSMTVPRARK